MALYRLRNRDGSAEYINYLEIIPANTNTATSAILGNNFFIMFICYLDVGIVDLYYCTTSVIVCT